MKDKDMVLKIYNNSKIIIGLLIAILLLAVVGVSKMYEREVVEDTKVNEEYDVSTFEEITAGDIKTKTKGTTKLVYIGRETCGWCVRFLPNIKKAQEELGFKTLYIDIAKIIDFNANKVSDENAYKTMMELTGEGYEDYMEENFGATPMMLVIKDNKIVNAQTGYSEYETFLELLKETELSK